MDDTMNEIRKVEDKYGLMPFRMAVTHLFDAGYQHFSDGDIEEDITQIIAQGEIDKANGKHSMLTPDFQCTIVRCAAELTRFSIWELFRYIKKHVVTD